MRPTDLVGPVVVHATGTIRYANDRFCALVGVDSPGAIHGGDLTQFVGEDDRRSLTTQFEQIQNSEAPTLGVRLELEDTSGETHQVVAVSSLVEWEGAQQIHTSFIDVSSEEFDRTVSLQANAMQEAPVGITIADATRDDEPLVYVNDGFVELTGYPREESVGKNCRFLQGEATSDEPVARMREAIEAGDPAVVELRNYRKDGSMFWNRVSILPVSDDSDELTHYLGFQEDISESKIYEQEKILFEEHAEASDQIMFITDRDGIIEYVNPAFERVTGYSAAEAVGEHSRLLNSDEQDAEFYDDLWETIEAGDIWESTLTNRTKSGVLFRVHQTIVPVTDDRGEITHYTAIERDISDEKLNRQVIDVLERVLRHNVRTAINVIDGYAEFLETDPPRSGRRTATKAIRDQTATLKRLSEQLTSVRKLIKGKDDPSPVGLRSISRIVRKVDESCEDARISLQMDVSDEYVVVNGSIFQVALETGIKNAIDANDHETPQVDVCVALGDGNEAVEISIADNGPGIPESEWQIVEAGVETPLEHTSGIGLWTLYWAVTAMGGKIERADNEPRGTVLSVSVPVAPASAFDFDPGR